MIHTRGYRPRPGERTLGVKLDSKNKKKRVSRLLKLKKEIKPENLRTLVKVEVFRKKRRHKF